MSRSEAVNPRRRAKRRMMRESGMSARQWRKFKRHMKRAAKGEMRDAGLIAD